ncbi:MAG: methyl-accepting chemotaxis protein [bacterium]
MMKEDGMGFRHMSLRVKLLTIGLLLSAFPLMMVLAIVLHQNRLMIKASSEECLTLALSGLDPVVRGVYAMCASQEGISQQVVNSSLTMARRVLNNTGQVSFSPDETCSWNAINQYTKEALPIELPKMMVGDIWLGQNKDINTPSAVVDEVRMMSEVTSTIFQRMDRDGNMLRVCTNVQKLDGTRAIGTYIPAINPDGKQNPVIAAVLDGKTYRGRAYVVNAWYITAYEPIFDSSRHVIGVLYVGVPEESITAGLKEEIKKLKFGKTGSVYVLDSKGNSVVSHDGRSDGDGKDASGVQDGAANRNLQQICSSVLALQPGSISEQRYSWRSSGDRVEHMKIAKVVFFQPWDWVIFAEASEDEILESQKKVMAIGRQGEMWLILTVVLTVLVTILIWIFTAHGIVGKLVYVVQQLTHTVSQAFQTSCQVAESSLDMAHGASDQAASLEEISSGLEEMSSMTKQNADSVRRATVMSNSARDATQKSMEAMARMSTAILKIKDSSDETSKIIKTIDEIAFQTNLLALNAAVEAAHAGDLGRGFAVVAEEVRNLAQRSAEAAKNTAILIDESRENTQNGVIASREVEEILGQIGDAIQQVTQLITEVSTASDAQAKGVEQINGAMIQIDQVMQKNITNADQSASASEKLSAQAGRLTDAVNVLRNMVRGNGNSSGEVGIRGLVAAYSIDNTKEGSGLQSQAHTLTHQSMGKLKDRNNLPLVSYSFGKKKDDSR